VDLNRRLAGDVYLGLVPVTQGAEGGLQLDGEGEPVEWLVHMRRLADEQALDRRIAASRNDATRLDDRQLDALAERLTAFYRGLPPLAIDPDDYVRHIATHVEGNRRAMLAAGSGLDAAAARRASAAQLRWLRTHDDALRQRVLDGRVVDGHGDLRPEHVYLNHSATVIDCLEFNAELRQVDVLDELGFLAMECDDLQAPHVGRRVIERYQRSTGDTPPAGLLPFYKSYRACVRAKVISLHARQLADEARRRELVRAADHLRLADRYAAEIAAPLLLVVRGLSGSGKSTLAARLAEELGIEVLASDAVRRELFGAEDAPAEYGRDRYAPANRQRVYGELHRRAAGLLAQRLSLILDATYLAADQRAAAVRLAREHAADALVIHCRCPLEVAQQRIGQRRATGATLSEADAQLPARQSQHQEPDTSDLPVVSVDAMRPAEEQVSQVYHALRG
jgi:aminoglycoside phosphotransferase family enzyme/predicted kinase